HGSERFSDEAVQPKEALLARGGAGRYRPGRRRGRDMSRWAVVLAGGIGSRFWPLSTPARPKQLLPLVSTEPLLVEAVDRLRPIVAIERVLILTNDVLVPAIAELLPDIPRANLVAEPRAGGTAAALTWASQEIARRDGPTATMISVHADWAIADAPGFQRALTRAAEAAEEHHALVTVGVVPTRADPGFGYIQPGDKIDNDVRKLTPEVAAALHAHADDLHRFFGAVTPVSVDVGVLERSDRVAVLPGDFGWDDVGTWGALRRVRKHDANGNAVQGRAYAVDARGNVVHAPEATVVLYGVSNLVAVVEDGLVLITTVDRSSDLK